MEQHPVPQNVTTFQFRLIGDMTIKQFGYLAGGAILAYICYKLPLPFFFSWPMATIAALAGVGFAFVPVEERPMDIWVMSFIKNVYNPTQFVWEKAPDQPKPAQAAPAPSPRPAVIAQPTTAPAAQPHAATSSPHPSVSAQAARPVSDVLAGIFTQPKPVPAAAPAPPSHPAATVQPAGRTSGPFDWLNRLFAPGPHPMPTQVVPHQNAPSVTPQAPAIATPSVTGRHLDLTPPPKVLPTETQMAAVQKRESELETKLNELKVELDTKTQTQARVLELQKQLTDVLSERDRMRKELEALRAKAAAPPPAAVVPQAQTPAQTGSTQTGANTAVSTPAAQPTTPQGPPAAARQQGPTVKIITPQDAVKAGLPRLTTFPNVVTGITRDSDNNLLPGVLVTVRDRDGVPVRALKTNRLGQFAASTPLANATYFVEIEDPRGRYIFDRVQITLNGSIVPALEIIAKSQKEVAREKLAKEIFGS